MPTAPPPPGTRERLLAAMTEALRRRGLHGMGLTELLQAADAPKGVLYHHFPGGKTELAVAAIEQAVANLCGGLDTLLQKHADPVLALRTWMAGAQAQLERSGFERGCPLAAVALESTPEDTTLRSALATGFAALRQRLAALLSHSGVPEDRARGLATLVVASYEGALIQARVAGHAQPMRDTADVLLALLTRELQAVKPAAAAPAPRGASLRSAARRPAAGTQPSPSSRRKAKVTSP